MRSPHWSRLRSGGRGGRAPRFADSNFTISDTRSRRSPSPPASRPRPNITPTTTMSNSRASFCLPIIRRSSKRGLSSPMGSDPPRAATAKKPRRKLPLAAAKHLRRVQRLPTARRPIPMRLRLPHTHGEPLRIGGGPHAPRTPAWVMSARRQASAKARPARLCRGLLVAPTVNRIHFDSKVCSHCGLGGRFSFCVGRQRAIAASA